MPSCNNSWCKCKPNCLSSERRSLGKRKKTDEEEWLKFKEYEMRTVDPSHEEVMVELDMCVSKLIEESIRFLSPRWKHVISMDINNRSSSKYACTLICVYNQLCDCNAKT